jgi:hypothetical protein
MKSYRSMQKELWYLKQTKYLCLTFKKSKLPRLVGHVDADWGGDSVVLWSSKKQKSVSLSSTESEYIAVEWSHQRGSVSKYNIGSPLTTQKTRDCYYVHDNQGAQELAKNAVFSHRTKHIDIKFHFIYEAVVEKNFLKVQEDWGNECWFFN